MTMLSPKARAFSVDHLLGRCEQQTQQSESPKAEKTATEPGEELCPLMGEEPTCSHRNTLTATDGAGSKVTVELCQGDLWQAFHGLGTEMIITKTGRRMFPAIRVRISGLKKSGRYRLSMDFVPVDKNKYRYVYHSSKWMVSGIGDGLKHERKYCHPESPFSGEYTASQVISFEKIKLTNNESPPDGQVSLLSMQKFQPRIIIQEQLEGGAGGGGGGGDSGAGSCFSVSFPQTSFIAVTAYQNQEITRLKIARNPFAKGFREAGKCRSSLEAMMASIGAYMDPKHGMYHRKRHMESPDEQTVDMLSSPAKRHLGLWPQLGTSPSMVPDSRYLSPYLPLPSSVPFLSNPYYYGDILYKRNQPVSGSPASTSEQYSDELDHDKGHSRSSVNSATYSATSSRDNLDRDSRDPDIHPAFRWTSDSAHSKYLDTKALPASSSGVVYNPLASIMYFPAPSAWPIPCSRPSETIKYDEVENVDSKRLSPAT